MQQTTKYVIKRDGSKAEIRKERIKERLESLCDDTLNMDFLNLDIVTEKVYRGISDGISTAALDRLSAETCFYMSNLHPDYSKLASRIEISNLHKRTDDDYLKVVERLDQMTAVTGENASMINPEVMRVVRANIDMINAKLDYQRDFNYDYFGFKTLERSYLLKELAGKERRVVERP